MTVDRESVGRGWIAYGPEWIIGWMALNRGQFLISEDPTVMPIRGAHTYGAAFLVTSFACFVLASVAPFAPALARSRLALVPMICAIVAYIGYAVNILDQFGADRVRGQAVDLVGIAFLCGWTWADSRQRTGARY